VKSLLDNDLHTSASLLQEISNNYPIVITRDIKTAKAWLKKKARGTERYGLLASSGGHRLRPSGLFIDAEIDVVNWFLNEKTDVRSSYYMEGVATEFDIQGLELDWACIAWDADLRYANVSWDFKVFRGKDWYSIYTAPH